LIDEKQQEEADVQNIFGGYCYPSASLHMNLDDR
jgi:hypothetical protein